MESGAAVDGIGINGGVTVKWFFEHVVRNALILAGAIVGAVLSFPLGQMYDEMPGEYGVLPGLGMGVGILVAIHGYRFTESIVQKWRRRDSEIDQ